ncbi:Outer-membrane lipoprotein carrier protein precursor [Candidatus Arsenophonus lipoptenae]|uniref:Outer-membrane lipoprotein carrier protein n=1 Tax=Candidatus Arsenophonus lipoptenae TaxID=634113 RepID=A0A109QEB0_9GAMM|nr:outer membrane lipoprotein chaperone LolA [Candidatus Arsenophonus lipoptenae]AMA65205.1 Outer-membrane lipoprotein carrier protein precursor [Candidatus Arsenophonus lipoptenae]
MKKIIILILLIISFFTTQVSALTASVELQKRLNKINSFYATFIQKVISIDGDLINQSKGHLWLKRPNLFNWHIFSPDKYWLISDGTNLWFYNPSIKQVTVTCLSSAITNTPFILIIRNNKEDWKRYQISQNGDNFLLIDKENKGNLKDFSITIEPNGTIQKFIMTEQYGQINFFQLKTHLSSYINDNKFKFIPPNNVSIDNQK